MDTPQTRRSFYYSFSGQIQYGYIPNTTVILLLIQNFKSDTVWIHPRYGGHSTTHSDFSRLIQTRYAPDTVAILSLIQILVTVQIHPRHGGHSANHTDLNSKVQSRYAPDTVAIPSLIQSLSPAHGCSIHRYSSIIQIQYRYTSGTAVILIFILHSNTVTTQIRPRRRGHSFSHTNSVSRYSSNAFQTRIPL